MNNWYKLSKEQPIRSIDEDGAVRYTLYDKLHREDGPAYERPDGYKAWHINGQYHRDDGPALIFPNGIKYWFQHDKLHREDGPAAIDAYGHEKYYLNDKELTKEEFYSQPRQRVRNLDEFEELIQ